MYKPKKLRLFNRPELLAPAGNFENFLAAVENGADAVYMGLPTHNARKMSQNFTMLEFKKAIRYAHVRNVKVYLTMNTLLYDDEIKEALKDLAELVEIGLDAVIVQDIGLASAIHEIFPHLPLHASTQMTIYNLEGVKTLESLGFSRVVLARELTIDEIRHIKSNTKVELEVFVHGAVCISYSGNCQLSNFVGNRSSNRGTCAQPCRLTYDLYDSTGERKATGHLLSNKDMYGLPYIKALTEIGIDSFKIEGRNKSPEYVAITVSKYVKYLDYIRSNIPFHVSSDDETELMQIFNRGGKSSHYFENTKGKDLISFSCAKNWGIPLGEVLEIKKNLVKVRLFADIDMHDGVEILSGELSGIVTCIRNENWHLLNAHVSSGQTVWIGDFKVKDRIREGTIIYKTSSSKLNKKYRPTFDGKTLLRKNHLSVVVTMKIDTPLTLDVYNLDYSLRVSSPKIVQKALKTPVTKYDIEEKLSKTKDTPFSFSNIICDIDDNSFIPISEINRLKSVVIEKFEQFYNMTYNINYEKQKIENISNKYSDSIITNINDEIPEKVKNDIYLYTYDPKVNYSKYKADRIYLDYSVVLKDVSVIDKFSYLGEVYIALPHNLKGNLHKIITQRIDEWSRLCDGFLIGNLCYFEIFKNMPDVNLVGDFSLNVTNNFSIETLNKLGLKEYTLSFELDDKHLKVLNRSHATVITNGQTPALTTEYCVVGSFASTLTTATPCEKMCVKSNDYYLIDEKGDKLKILCDNVNCSNRIFKDYQTTLKLDELKIYRKRINLL